MGWRWRERSVRDLAEFKKGDIAHISNGLRVMGVARPDAQSEEDAGIKRLSLRSGDALTIEAVHPSRDKYAKKNTGGAVYDATFEQEGVLYHIECIPQKNFCSKKGWEEYVRLRTELERLLKNRGGE